MNAQTIQEMIDDCPVRTGVAEWIATQLSRMEARKLTVGKWKQELHRIEEEYQKAKANALASIREAQENCPHYDRTLNPADGGRTTVCLVCDKEL
jgi:hypothetical protein